MQPIAQYPKRARIKATPRSPLLAVPPRPWAAGVSTGGNSILAAFDQAALAAVFTVRPLFGLAPD
jgi:hypothetical protein